MNHERINEYFNSQLFMIISFLAFAVLAGMAWSSGRFPSLSAQGGIFFAPDEFLEANGTHSLVATVAINVSVALLLHLLNKVFTFVRTYTFIAASSFVLFQASMPVVSANYYAGSTLALIAVVMAFILFASYQRKGVSQRSIYLIFTILATCATFLYSSIFLIVAFALGFMQMRAMNLKGALAMLLGIATPFWILLGLGVVSFSDFRLPEFERLHSIFSLPQAPVVIISAVGVVILTIILTVVNMVTIFNYRLQTRVYNAFFTTLATLSVIMMVVDFYNALIYMPMLNLCLAVQIAHAFTIAKFAKKHFVYAGGVLILILTYIANFIL
ncbi:MAG: hypothetical protein J6X81_05255 [Muribaculaceae bacterium]|nr:hypothetical protein [Muribaculaceae bacterium]